MRSAARVGWQCLLVPMLVLGSVASTASAPVGSSHVLSYAQIEAEAGRVVWEMSRAQDQGAFGGSYVFSQISALAKPGEQGRSLDVNVVVLTYDVPWNGDYFICARGRASGWSHNSFFVSVDKGIPSSGEIFHFEFLAGRENEFGTWAWDHVHDEATRDQSEFQPVYLIAGTYYLRLYGREADTWLDVLAITDSAGLAPCIPQAPTPTPSPTRTRTRLPLPVYLPAVLKNQTPTPRPTLTPTPRPTKTLVPTELPPWDDGSRDDRAAGRKGIVLGVHYSVSMPRRVKTVRYYLGGEMKPIRFVVWDANWAELYAEVRTPNAKKGGEWYSWQLPPGAMAPQTQFFAGFECLDDYDQEPQGPWVGVDTSSPIDEMTFAGPLSPGVPPPVRSDFDAMVRVVVW